MSEVKEWDGGCDISGIKFAMLHTEKVNKTKSYKEDNR